MFFKKYRTEEEKIEIIKKRPGEILTMGNPSETIQMISILQSPSNIRYIFKPVESVKFKAVELDPTVIEHISEQMDDLQVLAMRKFIEKTNGRGITLISRIYHPSDKVIEYVLDFMLSSGNSNVKENNFIIYGINRDLKQLPNNLSVKLDELISRGYVSKSIRREHYKRNIFLRRDILSFTYIPEEISHDELKELVTEMPKLIRYITHPSEEIQLEAVKEHPYMIRYIEEPTENIQMYVIKKDFKYSGYEYIKNLTENTIRYVIENCNDIDIIQSMRIDFDKLPDDLKLLLELKF